jgi:hypothetical protein
MKAKFPPGSIASTPAVLAVSNPEQIAALLTRHQSGDWGCMHPEDQALNDAIIEAGGRLMSAYPIDPALPCKGFGSNTIWIITEADRSVTTLLLPAEY